MESLWYAMIAVCSEYVGGGRSLNRSNRHIIVTLLHLAQACLRKHSSTLRLAVLVWHLCQIASTTTPISLRLLLRHILICDIALHTYRLAGQKSLPIVKCIAFSAGQSKLANIMFTYELAKRLQHMQKITVNCLHPGVVRTELSR